MVRRLLVLVSVVVGLLVVSVAGAAAAPLATTDPATAVTASDATVNGTLDANGGGTTVDCHFDWVDDATFQASAFDVPNQVGCNEGAAFDDGAQAVTGSLGGLVPGTLYHVRLVVSNATDTTFAVEQTFTTALAAPVLESFGTSASSITPTGATLSSSVNPNNADTTYRFDYGTTTAYGQSAPSPDASLAAAFGDQPVSTDISGLAPGTTYHYRISADNGTGGVQHGGDHTFSTAPATAGGASDVTATTATLNATVNPHGSAATYHLQYGTDTDYGTSTPETSAGGGVADITVTRAVTGLRPSTTYHVRAVATDTGSGVTTTGADGTFTTAPAPRATTTDATNVTTDHATLNGTVDTHGLSGVVRFTVTSTTSAYASSTPDQTLAAGAGSRAVSATLTDLPPGETYRVQVSVTSNTASSAGDVVTFSTAPLPVFPPPASRPALDAHPYGCAAPILHAYNQHPKPGTTITIASTDLGVGGTIALGTSIVSPTAWSSTGFTFTLPDDATGTLPLTVNCGVVSNTIAIQLYQPPSNTFTAKAKAKGTTVTLTLKVPGAGRVTATGASVKRATKHVTKAGTTTVKVHLTAKAIKSLKRHHKLRVAISVRFTPTGGTSAAKILTATHKTTS